MLELVRNYPDRSLGLDKKDNIGPFGGSYGWSPRSFILDVDEMSHIMCQEGHTTPRNKNL